MKKPEGLLLKDLKKAATILKNGGVVIFPTDTVYGIGCRFDDKEAIDRIYQIKGTPKDKPFPVLVSNISQVKKLAIITKVGQKLIDKYWSGALTIILPSRNKSRKIGFRMPDSEMIRTLIDKVGVPIIGTSANSSGQKAAKSFKDLDPKFVRLVDYVVKGICQGGIESTVVDATKDPPEILRKGAVSV